jgi:transcriptional regulator with XRE-family HTH domain
MNNIGTTIRTARTSKGISVRELARRCQCNPTYISGLETLKHDAPTVHMIAQIEKALELPERLLLNMEPMRRQQVVGEFLRDKPDLQSLVYVASKLSADDVQILLRTANFLLSTAS